MSNQCIRLHLSLYVPLNALFLYTLKRLSSSLFSLEKAVSGENNSNFNCMQRKFDGKIKQNFKYCIQILGATKIATKSATKSAQYS